MFTGIIEEVGTVQGTRFLENRAEISIRARTVTEDLNIGASIAVNGVCLTAVDFSQQGFVADVSPETLQVTNLRTCQAGTPVNLERALRVSDRLDGHIVQGHVDDTATLLGIEPQGETILLRMSMPENISRYIVPKGSITVDGISLTVNACDADSFRCMIIPHTLQHTNLRFRQAGDSVNLESDVIGRYVEHLLPSTQDNSPHQTTLDMELLRKHGWV